jgi:hypothetical protein
MVDYHTREKNITLWKKNITLDFVSGDIFSRVWVDLSISSGIDPVIVIEP